MKKSYWIWNSPERYAQHEIVWFKKNFDTNTPNAQLKISADTDFIAFVNGIEAGRNQFNTYPEKRVYQLFDISNLLVNGKNEIKVQVYHTGENFFGHCKGPAGLWAEIVNGDEIIECTDASWQSAVDPFHIIGTPKRMTPQLGFIFETDLSRPDVMDFKNAVVFDEPAPANLRPTRTLVRKGLADTFILAQGEIFRKENAVDIYDDFLHHVRACDFYKNVTSEYPETFNFPQSFTVKDGAYILIDLKKESTGLLSFKITTSETIRMDAAHGEHLIDGKVRAKVGPRYFVDKFTLKKGENIFELPFRIIGGRYLELHFYGNAEISIDYATLNIVEYPLPEPANFKCNDSWLNKMDEVCIRTLHLCMHNHYEDCPWREQGLYGYDSRNQALYGYEVWGNYDYVRANFNLLSDRKAETGWLELCAPSEIPLTIPVFTFAWLGAVADYTLFSGKTDLLDENRENIDKMFNVFMKLYNAASGIFTLPQDSHLWHFYEWLPGLSGADGSNPILGAPAEVHALFNLYLLEVMRFYADWKNDAAIAQKADDLAQAIHKNFYDDKAGYYKTSDKGGKHFHVQILAIYCKIVPEDKLNALIEKITSGEFGEITFEPMPFMLKALMPYSAQTRKYFDSFLKNIYLPMIGSGATSVWEVPMEPGHCKGGWSLCHGWASLPSFYFRSYVLGIRPLTPGFKKFSVNPYLEGITECRGEIVTPAGKIYAEWEKKDGALYGTIKHPSALEPEIISHPEMPVADVKFEKY